MSAGCSGQDTDGTPAGTGVDVVLGDANPSFQTPDQVDAVDDVTVQVPDVPPVTEDVPVVCTPNCGDRECGTDGCDGECGQCGEFEVCSNSGFCGPDPRAGCAGLSLAENWSGTFEGSYSVSAYSFFPGTEGDTDGDISFSLKCFNSKLIISGQATGTASGDNPFELDMSGYFNPETNEFEGQVPSGKLILASSGGVIDLEGDFPGILQVDGSLIGTYEVHAVKAVLPIIGELDVALFPASSSGTWVAYPAP